MDKKIFLLIFGVLLGPLNSFAKFRAIDAFAVIDHDRFTFEAEKLVPNMPLVQSQDTLGICFGFSAGACAQQYYCQRRKLNCQNLPPEKKISPLQMAAYSTEEDTTDVLAYTAIPNSGNTARALIVGMTEEKMAFADSCFPWDKFVSKYSDDPKAIDALFKKLRDAYKQQKTEGTTCLDCLSNTLNNDFDLKIDNIKLLEALGTKTYQHFLYSIFFKHDSSQPYCNDVIDFGFSAAVGTFPKEGTTADYDSAMKTIKDVINMDTPVNLGGICMEKQNGKCACVPTESGTCLEARHGVAISGYRKACRKAPECKNQCNKSGCYVESLKVHNSWGQSWQKQFDDGWVDARTLLNETRLDAGALSWVYKDPKKM